MSNGGAGAIETMTRDSVIMPVGGPFADTALPVFTSKNGQYVYVARTDIGRYMRDTSMVSLKEFLQCFRQYAHVENSIWNKFTLLEKNMPLPLHSSHKPAFRESGWAAPHIYSIMTLTGFAAILSGSAGGTKRVLKLFPQCTVDYLYRCAEACLQKHCQITGTHLTIDMLAKYIKDGEDEENEKEEEDEEEEEEEDEEDEKSVPIKGMHEWLLIKGRQRYRELCNKRHALKSEIQELKVARKRARQLTEDAKAGLLYLLPFTEQDVETGAHREMVIEIDIDGSVYRKRRSSYNESDFKEHTHNI